MKNLNLKQILLIGLSIVLILVGAYFMSGPNPFKQKEVATEERLKEIQEEQDANMKKVTEIKPPKPEEESKIFNFAIKSSVQEIPTNSNVKLEGVFDGQGEYDRKIIWTIAEPHHADTWINEEGLLNISEKENQNKIIIKAVPKADESKAMEIAINITNPFIEKKAETPKPKVTVKPKTKKELKEKVEEAQSSITEAEKENIIAEQEKVKQEAIAATTGGAKDKYQTDPTPSGKPKPVEPGNIEINKEVVKKATLSIKCDTIFNNMELFNKDKIDVLPLDGTILPSTTVDFYEGESVFDVLDRTMKEKKIHMEYVFTPVYNSVYIEGIHNLYEFDCGPLSGWMYKVNGWFPNYGCSRYKLEEGDVIEWVYTCDLGQDVGDNSMTGNKE